VRKKLGEKSRPGIEVKREGKGFRKGEGGGQQRRPKEHNHICVASRESNDFAQGTANEKKTPKLRQEKNEGGGKACVHSVGKSPKSWQKGFSQGMLGSCRNTTYLPVSAKKFSRRGRVTRAKKLRHKGAVLGAAVRRESDQASNCLNKAATQKLQTFGKGTKRKRTLTAVFPQVNAWKIMIQARNNSGLTNAASKTHRGGNTG